MGFERARSAAHGPRLSDGLANYLKNGLIGLKYKTLVHRPLASIDVVN